MAQSKFKVIVFLTIAVNAFSLLMAKFLKLVKQQIGWIFTQSFQIVKHGTLMHNQCRSMSIGMAKSTGDLVPHFKENQMEKFIEWTLAIVIFGGIGVLLAWRG
jgi:hypothetical protein